MPDVGLYDVQRMEMLKGPQGTLYGEGAQGGAIKILVNKAHPDEFMVKGELGTGQTYNGSGRNHSQQVALNLPLYGSWATRLVASKRVEQGYIDFPNRNTEGENDVWNQMARLHLDGNVTDTLSLSIMHMQQHQRMAQLAVVQLKSGDLKNNSVEPEFTNVDFGISSVTIDWDVGFATLTSATSCYTNDREALYRYPFISKQVESGNFGGSGVPTPEGAIDYQGEWIDVLNEQAGLSQEFRLVSNAYGGLHSVAGVYYRTRDNNFDYLLTNGLSDDWSPPLGPGYLRQEGVNSFEQNTVFAEVTAGLPWNLELAVGLRWFKEMNELSGRTTLRNFLYPLAVLGGAAEDGSFPERHFSTTTEAVTPKLALAWALDDDRMIYAQVAQGVRSGGANVDATYVVIPPLYEPDILTTYEVGAKSQWFDGLLTANIAVFRNEWKDLQVKTYDQDAPTYGEPSVVLGGTPFVNAGKAFSQGVELQLTASPLEGLSIGLNVFAAEGEITEGDPAQTVPDGTEMPQLADLSYSAFVRYKASQWPVFGFVPSVQLDGQSTGERSSAVPVENIPGNFTLEGFETYSALLQFDSPSLTLSLGMKNITDERTQLAAC